MPSSALPAVHEQRRSLRAITKNPELFAALALGCLYLALISGHLHSIDGLLVYRQARSIAYEHSLRFATPLWWGEVFTTSKYGIGLSLLYLPGLLAGWPLQHLAAVQHGQTYDFGLLYADRLYTVAVAPVHLVVTAASAYLVARFIRALGFARGPALWGLALYGLASPAIVYARGDVSQPLSGLCWIVALYAAVRFRRDNRTSLSWVSAGALAYAVLTRPVEGALLFPAVLILLAPDSRPLRWRRADWRPLAVVALGFLAGTGLTLLINWGRYGSPFATGYANEGWTTPLATGLAGALVSPGRGILWEFPAILLVPLGLKALWTTGQRRAALALLILPSLQLVNVATWDAWWGGWGWGLRLFVPALPILAVGAGIGVGGLPSAARRWLPAVLLLAGAAWALPCILTDILGGYAQRYDGSAASFALSAYPPIGAWRSFHHWRAFTFGDPGAADILWLRLAHRTHNLSLVLPLVFTAAAASLAGLILRPPVVTVRPS